MPDWLQVKLPQALKLPGLGWLSCWAAGKKSEIFVYLTVRRILIGDTDTDRTAHLTVSQASPPPHFLRHF